MRDRTADLLDANQALSQLSYSPKHSKKTLSDAEGFSEYFLSLNLSIKPFLIKSILIKQ